MRPDEVPQRAAQGQMPSLSSEDAALSNDKGREATAGSGRVSADPTRNLDAAGRDVLREAGIEYQREGRCYETHGEVIVRRADVERLVRERDDWFRAYEKVASQLAASERTPAGQSRSSEEYVCDGFAVFVPNSGILVRHRGAELMVYGTKWEAEAFVPKGCSVGPVRVYRAAGNAAGSAASGAVPAFDAQGESIIYDGPRIPAAASPSPVSGSPTMTLGDEAYIAEMASVAGHPAGNPTDAEAQRQEAARSLVDLFGGDVHAAAAAVGWAGSAAPRRLPSPSERGAA